MDFNELVKPLFRGGGFIPREFPLSQRKTGALTDFLAGRKNKLD
jgi:hypothetical protein